MAREYNTRPQDSWAIFCGRRPRLVSPAAMEKLEEINGVAKYCLTMSQKERVEACSKSGVSLADVNARAEQLAKMELQEFAKNRSDLPKANRDRLFELLFGKIEPSEDAMKEMARLYTKNTKDAVDAVDTIGTKETKDTVDTVEVHKLRAAEINLRNIRNIVTASEVPLVARLVDAVNAADAKEKSDRSFVRAVGAVVYPLEQAVKFKDWVGAVCGRASSAMTK